MTLPRRPLDDREGRRGDFLADAVAGDDGDVVVTVYGHRMLGLSSRSAVRLVQAHDLDASELPPSEPACRYIPGGVKRPSAASQPPSTKRIVPVT